MTYLNGALVVEGTCWDCHAPLEQRPDGFAHCPRCGHAFRVTGSTVTERMPIDIAGPWSCASDLRMVRGDGRVEPVPRDEHDLTTFPPDVIATECEWPLGGEPHETLGMPGEGRPW